MVIFSKSFVRGGLIALAVFGSTATVAYASHSWGNYHWARTANPFTLKLGDNVSTTWDAYLSETSSDWSTSGVLDTTVVTGGTDPSKCRATSGRVEVCNRKYGFNGWLGVAQIWISGDHITKGTAKLNDSYFNLPTYNTSAWRRLVMCQEIAHDFGLDHQDEIFNNPNLGTCMDYTNDPDGGVGGVAPDDPSNEHPNAHDYEQLGTIYTHLDSFTTLSPIAFAPLGHRAEVDDIVRRSKAIRKDGHGRTSLYESIVNKDERVLTFVFWAE